MGRPPVGPRSSDPKSRSRYQRRAGVRPREMRLGAGAEQPRRATLEWRRGVIASTAESTRHDGTPVRWATDARQGRPPCNCGNHGCPKPSPGDRIAADCGTDRPRQPSLPLARRSPGARGMARSGATRHRRRTCGLLFARRVVIGGGIGRRVDLLLEPIREELRRRVQATLARRGESCADSGRGRCVGRPSWRGAAAGRARPGAGDVAAGLQA